jgi:hypothetical protein
MAMVLLKDFFAHRVFFKKDFFSTQRRKDAKVFKKDFFAHRVFFKKDFFFHAKAQRRKGFKENKSYLKFFSLRLCGFA